MRKNLALFLALAMIFSLVPMNVTNVFAASENRMISVPKVADDYEGWLTAPEEAPMLRIEEKDDGEFSTTQTLTLTLTNAEWDSTSAALMAANDELVGNEAGETITYTKRTDKKMEVVIGTISNDHADELKINIPLVCKITDKGDAKVKVDSDNAVSDSEHVFATSSAGATITTIGDEGDNSFGDTVELAAIEIAEKSSASIEGVQDFVLQLPTGFKWQAASEAGTISYAGGFQGIADSSDITIDPDNSKKLEITTADLGTSTSVGRIYIEGLEIKAESKAKAGDVKITIYGDDHSSNNDDITKEEFLAAKYQDYTITVTTADEEADLPVLLAGEYEGVGDSDHEVSVVTIEEEIASSWLVDRRTRIEFPEWVKVLDVDVESDTDNFTETNAAILAEMQETCAEGGDDAKNYVELSGLTKADTSDKCVLEAKFYVSIQGDKSGDIELNVTGTAVGGQDQKVKVAVAKAPIEVTIDKVAETRVGFQDQVIGKITITETLEAAMKEDNNLVLKMDDSWFKFSEEPTVKVTKGNVEIDEEGVEVDGGFLIIPIDSESSEPSTIEITNAKVDLDRSVPEGDFWVEVGGSAVIRNATEFMDNDDGADAPAAGITSKEGGFSKNYVVKPTVLRVITPAPGDTQTGEKVVFTIDSKEYMIGANKVTSDVAPYINEQGRTMLPVRALANAMNVKDEQIHWNEVERSVTIFKGERIIKVVIGQMSYSVNGTSVPMDTYAVIKDSRTFLPLRAIAQAMDTQVVWDEATRTVTVQ